MREYGKDIYADSWLDEKGVEHKTLSSRRLNYSQPGPRNLRDFVFRRDKNICVVCNAASQLVIDHIVSLKNNGTNHPANLRVLCNTCNTRKTGLFDSRNVYANPHITNGIWVVSEECGEIRVGVLCKDKSVSFCLESEIAVGVAQAILSLSISRRAHNG